jgi:hypothetical protein
MHESLHLSATMSSVHAAPEKKRLSYERDHRVRGGENDKAFRRKWPIKKSRANRSFRRAAGTMTRSAVTHQHEEVDFGIIKNRPLTKWGVATLRETVANRQALRRRRVGTKAARRAGKDTR